MKRSSLLLVGLVASMLCGALVVWTHTARSQQPAPDAASERLDALLRERVDTFQQIVKIAVAEHEAGVASLEEVLNAYAQLADAEIELTDKHDERVEILKRRLEGVKKLERAVQARHKIGQESKRRVLQAQAERLLAEIQPCANKPQRSEGRAERSESLRFEGRWELPRSSSRGGPVQPCGTPSSASCSSLGDCPASSSCAAPTAAPPSSPSATS